MEAIFYCQISKLSNCTLILCCTIWIPINVYIFLLINFVFNPGNYVFSLVVDVVLFWLDFHLLLLGLLYILINTFRYFLDKRIKIFSRMNKYSYGVYIIHFIVMGAMASILLNTDIGSLAKYVILAGSTFFASNLIVSFFKEIIQRVWNQIIISNRLLNSSHRYPGCRGYTEITAFSALARSIDH